MSASALREYWHAVLLAYRDLTSATASRDVDLPDRACTCMEESSFRTAGRQRRQKSGMRGPLRRRCSFCWDGTEQVADQHQEQLKDLREWWLAGQYERPVSSSSQRSKQ
ncbi:unnamed protein product [Vitrella brassicaformis CCMP3155]|uniref:Uncharacterized protein n=2 Tax=Vitrella brassicaformis TaxID=1169539 RepID=A0A0G4EL62_VITBC|nr:unnamed protein product [Vitrella brassicaformis CCMP3155]|eukprot:CEL97131.1 unnamed protein product [Vitrella brassicaformis CCMP3155]